MCRSALSHTNFQKLSSSWILGAVFSELSLNTSKAHGDRRIAGRVDAVSVPWRVVPQVEFETLESLLKQQHCLLRRAASRRSHCHENVERQRVE